jgi:hypothetical protein
VSIGAVPHLLPLQRPLLCPSRTELSHCFLNYLPSCTNALSRLTVMQAISYSRNQASCQTILPRSPCYFQPDVVPGPQAGFLLSQVEVSGVGGGALAALNSLQGTLFLRTHAGTYICVRSR